MHGTGDAAMNDSWRPRRILAATDFSAAAERAVERAARLAADGAARLSLAHVVAAGPWTDLGAQVVQALGVPTESWQAAQATAAERLQRRAQEVRERHRIACDTQVAAGRPAAELARLAADFDLLAIGARGADAVAHAALGTTAQRLVRASPCPALIVRRAPQAPYRRVLAPTDFSAPARAALLAVAQWLPQAQLHIAHAFELPYDGLMRYAAVDEAAVAHYHEAAYKRLYEDLTAWADEAGIAAGRRALHVEHGHPTRLIERWIRALGIDLVAIAAHGKSELEATFLGSVSLHTVFAARCDVWLARGAAFG